MTNLINTPKTMTSLEFLDVVNASRIASGESPHEPRKFLAKVEDELDDLTGKKFRLNNNQSKTYYYDLTVDQCMLVGMRESKSVRRSVLAKLKELEAPQVPQTYAAALLEAGRLALENERLQLEAQENAPKLEVYSALADRKGDVSTTLIAKQLGMTAIKLNKFLREKGVKWEKADLPKAGYQDWFNVIADTRNGHEYTQCLVTPLGQIEIAKLINKEGK